MLIVTALLAYLLGSIPFGILIARIMGLGDLRQIGSGNIGATNVLRTGNKLAAALTLIGDAGKGAVAVLIARALVGEDAALVAGVAAFVGHCYPIYLRFKGGKGVATFIGTVLALHWPYGLLAVATWIAMAGVFRISSLAALTASALIPLIALLFGNIKLAVALGLMTAVIYHRHAANITRLRAGTEPKIGKK
ncbi:glycerol-3-phosphate 1-O-acyltransferase PlsY [Palleronia caenipelagi]|uniref:Glycerol-3-phosphate acyltransferase n=1 Tax=Palleronia caenipelagi TaxID=2489174 RepID=A0A547Q8Q1_9RHOB|nr:glycerol-3-phosphate 1-O-acyltransferase PlsY [Palleronia caenipelagi]TRD22748.1 glycerol-3-phosphate 1-O-acyltransferase PlsY [Palleronia caenipelagi]